MLGTGLGMGKEIFIFEPPRLFYLRLKEGKNKVCLACVFGASLGRSLGGRLSLPSDLPLALGNRGDDCFPPYTGTGKCFYTQIWVCGGTQDSAISPSREGFQPAGPLSS